MTPYDRDLDKNPANYQPLTPLTFLERSAARVPGPDGDHPRPAAAQLRASSTPAARRLASALAKRGIGRGDTVAVMLANTPAMLECHYGVPMTGAVLNTLNTRLDAAVIAFFLDHGEAKVLITDREFSKTIKEALAQAQGEAARHRLRRPGVLRPRRAPRRRSTTRSSSPRATRISPGACRTTSGTRSRSTTPRARPAIPRASSTTTAAPISWRSATSSPAAWASTRSISGRCRCSTATAGASRGRSRSAPARMSACATCAPKAMFEALAEHGVTHLCGAPIVMSTLLNAPADEKRRAAARGPVLHRRGAAAGGRARGHEGGGLQRHPSLRPDRDLRPGRRQRLARGVGRPRGPGRRRQEGAPGRALRDRSRPST